MNSSQSLKIILGILMIFLLIGNIYAATEKVKDPPLRKVTPFKEIWDTIDKIRLSITSIDNKILKLSKKDDELQNQVNKISSINKSLISSYVEGKVISTDQETKGWWNSDWNYRKEIKISNSVDELKNYSILLKVKFDSGMNKDFSDLRFIDLKDNELDYFIENKIDEEDAIVWVMIPTIPSDETSSFYVYYGNSKALTKSNFNDTFIFADDFQDSSTLNRYETSSYCTFTTVITNGTLILGSSSNAGVCTVTPKSDYQSINENYIIESKMYISKSESAANPHLAGISGLGNSIPLSLAYDGYSEWVSDEYTGRYFGINGFFAEWLNSTTDYRATPYDWNTLKFILKNESEITAIVTNGSDFTNSLTYSGYVHGTTGYYGMSFYGGGDLETNATYDWFRVRPYAKVEPTYSYSDVEKRFPEINLACCPEGFVRSGCTGSVDQLIQPTNPECCSGLSEKVYAICLKY